LISQEAAGAEISAETIKEAEGVIIEGQEAIVG
jgi:hypothetical protein